MEGVFLWGVLSDNKIICDKFKLAKYGGIDLVLPNLSVKSEERNDCLNDNRAVRIPSEEAERFNGNVKMSASLSMA